MGSAGLVIRGERAEDIERIHAIECAAFARRDEADLVDRLRDADALWLSQVAVLDGKVVGHAAYSLADVAGEGSVWQFPALGPIAVSPAHQRQGIGGALIRRGLRAISEAGYGLVFLVGHPGYYPRFGFQPAQPLGFTSDYVRADGPHAHFMVAVLDARCLATVRGALRFHSAFDGI